jgi:insertion element IS1 protein InsB
MRFHLGDRSRKNARTVWANFPEAYRRHATFDTDLYVVYVDVIPAAQHRAMSNKARQSHHLEHFNHTLRQRVSRLLRRALSCSKTLATPIGAIKMCMGHGNLVRVTV